MSSVDFARYLSKALLGLEALPANMPGVVPPTLFRQNPQENGGGFLVDGGSHLICELIWCSGLRVQEVTAQMDNVAWDVRAVLTLGLENGALATLSNLADSAIRDKRQHSLYYGSSGTAIVRGFPARIVLETDGQTQNIHEQELPAPPSPVGNLVDYMLGQGQPEISGQTAVHVVEVLSAAYESAQTGKRVKI